MSYLSKMQKYAILDDPMIRQMMQADGVSRHALAALMSEVAERLEAPGGGNGNPIVYRLDDITSRSHPLFETCSSLLRMQCKLTMH